MNGVVAVVVQRHVVKGGRCRGPVGGVGAARRGSTTSVEASVPGQWAEGRGVVLTTDEL